MNLLGKKSSSNETKLSLTWSCAKSASSGGRCYYFVFTLRDMVINKYFHQFLILIFIVRGHAMVDWREVLFWKTMCFSSRKAPENSWTWIVWIFAYFGSFSVELIQIMVHNFNPYSQLRRSFRSSLIFVLAQCCSSKQCDSLLQE